MSVCINRLMVTILRWMPRFTHSKTDLFSTSAEREAVVVVWKNGNNLTRGAREEALARKISHRTICTKNSHDSIWKFCFQRTSTHTHIFPAICAREKKEKHHRFSLLLNVPLQNQKRNEWMKTRRKNHTNTHTLAGTNALVNANLRRIESWNSNNIRRFKSL